MQLQTTGSVKAPGIGGLISYRNDGKGLYGDHRQGGEHVSEYPTSYIDMHRGGTLFSVMILGHVSEPAPVGRHSHQLFACGRGHHDLATRLPPIR